MMAGPRLTLAAALVLLGLLAAVVLPRLTVATDMSFFMPSNPTPEVAALSNGLERSGSLIMIGLHGADDETLARASDVVTAALRGQEAFAAVANGRPHLPQALYDFVIEHRFLLGPPADLSTEGLREDLTASVKSLATLQGWAFRETFPRDPTGRMAAITGLLSWDGGPPRRHGVWMDDMPRALILAQLHAPAGDLPAQGAARAAIAEAATPLAHQGITWAASGPGLFALEASEHIRGEMQILTTAATVLVALLLLAAFRAPVMLALVGLPVASGLLVGAALTQALFGHVHGVAVTFGGVLAGVAADYPIHLAGLRAAGETPRQTARRLARPLFLGAATTIAGLLALSQSSFPGLAQIGTLAASAMFTAILISRWLLPSMIPARPMVLHGAATLWRTLRGARHGRARARWLVAGIVAVTLSAAVLSATPLWDTRLDSLGVADAARKALDRDLRAGLHLPDTARLLLVEGRDAQDVLRRQAELLPALDEAVADGRLGGYRAAASLLPPVAEQTRRQDAMPTADVLRARLTEATHGLPLAAPVLTRLVDDIARQKAAAALRPETVAAGPAGALVPAPWPAGAGWAGAVALVPPVTLAEGEFTGAGPDARLIDLRVVAATLLTDYRTEALGWLAVGSLAGLALLAAGLRHPRRILRAALPPAGAVVFTGSLLVALGVPLTMFHILALLLVASVGVDYALFFSGYSAGDTEGAKSLHSVALCSLTTATVFTVLAFSAVPVLSAIGMTVAIGSVSSFALTLLFCDA